MIQFRLKEGSAVGERRWFNPERDIVNVWPKLLRQALESLDTFTGMEGCTLEQMNASAGSLGKQVATIIKEPVDYQMSAESLKQWREDCPACADEIMRRSFAVLHGVFATWVVDAKPKVESDVEVPTMSLGQIAAWLAKNAPTAK